ncbi:MAG: polyphosphate polymerase domain-containing protein [Spirochaetales bacterium]|nr:polyphosphate polymerase domain-containing protein [Spirochaetales bacterium]
MNDGKNGSNNHISLFRNELKYYIGYIDYVRIREILSRFMKTDSHSRSFDGYWIRSLYFDTPDNKEYMEKIMGIEERKKIRLRLYNVETDQIKLEIKNKYNDYLKKETAFVTREQASMLINGVRSFLLNPGNPVLNRVYCLMAEHYYSPVVVIDYMRDAFVEDFNNIRITFDRNITACATDFDIFRLDLHLFPVFESMTVVMEVKYNVFLPAWLKMVLSCIQTVNSAISKYCYGRETYNIL